MRLPHETPLFAASNGPSLRAGELASAFEKGNGRTMNTHRRDFLRKISSVAALAASGSVLKKDAEAAAIHTSHLTGMYGDLELGTLRDPDVSLALQP
jgi:hypothetical protein